MPILALLYVYGFCIHRNTQHTAPFDIYPKYPYPFMVRRPLHNPLPQLFTWKDQLNICFIQDLLFINYYQIYEHVSMATEFFRVRGMSERKNTIFKRREVQNINNNYISKYRSQNFTKK